MEQLTKIIAACKCSVNLTINGHKDYYESVPDYFNNKPWLVDDKEEISKEVFDKMVEHDTIVELQIYPDTPVGFYKIYHHDLEQAIDEAMEILKIK